MVDNLLIDESGESWPANSWTLARRIGYRDARTDLASFAVRERGFIHLRPFDDGVRVALRSGGFSRITLAGAMQALNELDPCRILMLVLGAERGQAELFGSVFAFVERAESLTTDAPLEVKVPRLSIERSARNLETAAFTSAKSVVRLWRERRGRLDEDIHQLMTALPAFSRTVLVRQRAAELITEYIGGGFGHLRPCESVYAVGRDFSEMPDREYGAWVADSYLQAAAGHRLRVESVWAQVRTSAATVLRARYDRILLPWRSRNEMLVMGASVRRELSSAD